MWLIVGVGKMAALPLISLSQGDCVSFLPLEIGKGSWLQVTGYVMGKTYTSLWT